MKKLLVFGLVLLMSFSLFADDNITEVSSLQENLSVTAPAFGSFAGNTFESGFRLFDNPGIFPSTDGNLSSAKEQEANIIGVKEFSFTAPAIVYADVYLWNNLAKWKTYGYLLSNRAEWRLYDKIIAENSHLQNTAREQQIIMSK